MMQTLTRPAPAETRRERRTTRPSLSRRCEMVVDAAVIVLATWTVVYHVSLVLRLGVPWAVGLEVAALVGWVVVSRRFGARLRDGDDASDPEATAARADDPPSSAAVAGATRAETGARGVAVLSGALAALLVAIDGAWPVIAALWLIAAAAGTAAAVAGARRTARAAPGASVADRLHVATSTGAVIALVWATALAALSMFTHRPNPDDLYYVNLSQWVVDQGTFPLRDTIFSDLAFPMSSWPPVASYDGLAGALALLTGVHAASIVYLVVPPVATFLSVLALWRLLRAWRIPAVGIALSLTLAFLLFDGGPGYAAPGTLFLTRIWQGKVILLCLMVPTLLVYALRYVERPSRTHAWWLFVGGVAAVGLTTSAMFLVPLIALAGAAPLALRSPRRALAGFGAMAAYPLAAGVVTLAVGGRSADFFETRRLFRFDPAWFGPEIFRDGPIALLAVLAVLVGALLIPHHAGRVTTGILAVIVGVTFVPGVTHVAFDLVGLGPTLWRVSWIVPIAALVGVFGVGIGSLANRRGAVVAVAGALAVTLAVTGIPIWSEDNGVELDVTPQWKRGPATVRTAQLAIDRADPGDLILAHQQLAVTITVLTTRVKTVAPRDYFMDYLRDDPRFNYDERQTLLRFVNEEFVYNDRPEVARALRLLDVDQVCIKTGSPTRVGFLRSVDYELVFSSLTDICFTRRAPRAMA
ncbi:MAG: hypothetical protein KY460_02455 [Actinobacteria bacterium]|nr:hypothetical protein [Actinomycetota bacterium]